MRAFVTCQPAPSGLHRVMVTSLSPVPVTGTPPSARPLWPGGGARAACSARSGKVLPPRIHAAPGSTPPPCRRLCLRPGGRGRGRLHPAAAWIEVTRCLHLTVVRMRVSAIVGSAAHMPLGGGGGFVALVACAPTITGDRRGRVTARAREEEVTCGPAGLYVADGRGGGRWEWMRPALN